MNASGVAMNESVPHRSANRRRGNRKLRLLRDSATIGLSHVAGWMENDRAIIFGLKLTDKPNPNYDLYRYVFETRHLRRLTRDARNEKFPDWIEGSLSVSPHGKLPTRVGRYKGNGDGRLAILTFEIVGDFPAKQGITYTGGVHR